MNAIEIEEAVSKLAESPFDSANFPFLFLEAFGNKPTTIQRLRSNASNKSDIGGVLQQNNIHIAVCPEGKVHETLQTLRTSPATAKQKAKYILSTDGHEFQAEDLNSGETIVCSYNQFPNQFGFFLPLAGISTVKQIRESSFDIRATGRLNRLYIELLRDNPEWGTTERRHDMNHFMARLIFCFFAEDTDIFLVGGLFSRTAEQMSSKDSSNTHEVIREIFRSMNTKIDEREKSKLPRWVNEFPYVNGGLFSGSVEVPRFSKIARSYLLHIGSLEWKRINPDIFGSMIQAVTEDEERGELGMHYTSVPNILRVLTPLFLNDLHSQLEKAGDNARMLLNLRKRISKIRLFDPACGSGNFLVIAYKEMRAIEAEINKRRGEPDARTEILLTNFRGIELRDFPSEIARLALIIAEYQCNVLYRGQKEALLEFLPLEAENWIVCGNSLRIEWETVCPKLSPGEEGEIYLCGNPPYSGYNKQSQAQKDDLEHVFKGKVKNWGNLDYVAAWFVKTSIYLQNTNGAASLVATNSICQGGQVSVLWPLIDKLGSHIHFAYTSFKWSNLAANNAGITVVIIGLSNQPTKNSYLYEIDAGETSARNVEAINGYLIPGPPIYVSKQSSPISELSQMNFGNHPYYAADLIMTASEARALTATEPRIARYLRPIYGSAEVVRGTPRTCIWIEDGDVEAALEIPILKQKIESVREAREKKKSDNQARMLVSSPHRFRDMFSAQRCFIAVPQTTSENREYLPCALLDSRAVVTFKCYAIYDAPLWNMAIIASKLHTAWIATVCGRMRTDFSYSNTLGWNTFPVPKLTEQNISDLGKCAEEILLAREAHFPATIADLYDPEVMPENLRMAHDRLDEVLERIYIGRRFRNDSERVERLFDLYTKMSSTVSIEPKAKMKKPRKQKTNEA